MEKEERYEMHSKCTSAGTNESSIAFHAWAATGTAWPHVLGTKRAESVVMEIDGKGGGNKG
jgi:hypothetical protein